MTTGGEGKRGGAPFKAKYVGRCTACGRWFHVGDDIKASAVKGYMHAGRDTVGEDQCDPLGIDPDDCEPDWTQG